MPTLTPEEFKKRYGDQAFARFKAPEKEPGFLSRVKSRFVEAAEDITEEVTETKETLFSDAPITQKVGRTVRAGLRTSGEIAGTAIEPIVQAPGVKDVLEGVGKGITKIEELAQKISGADETTSELLLDWAEKHPEASKDIEAVLDIAALLPFGKGVQAGAKGATRAARATEEAVSVGVQRVKQAGTQALERGTSSFREVAKPIVAEAERLPERFRTNLAQKRVAQEAIDELPTRVARNAAQDGIEIADINFIRIIKSSQKNPLKKLATVVRDFARGNTKTNPIEVVGKPIITRIKQLEKTRKSVGSKLGDAAENLGKVADDELKEAVFSELKRVPGLEEISQTMFGKLDFGKTTLASQLSKSERQAIRKIYETAVKPGTGRSKHLLRQELFEILGGKKRSLSNITSTQEKSFEAIRRGLSKVLESKNSAYRKLSNDYRKIIQPLQDMRVYMKKVVGAQDDILDMSAGLLARRLTSAAKSNPEIRNVLRSMDAATAVPGKSLLSVEVLQDFYNILEKYYDIAPKTGFQAQVKQGVEKAVSGPLQFAGEQFKSFLGETPIVRQEALEKLLKEILG